MIIRSIAKFFRMFSVSLTSSCIILRRKRPVSLKPGLFLLGLLDGQLERASEGGFYTWQLQRDYFVPKTERLKCPHGRKAGEVGRMAEMAKLTCLIREKTTVAFVKDWKHFMECFLLKAERMNLGFDY